MNTNLKRLQTELSEKQLPAFIVSSPASVRWLTEFTGSFALVIVTPDSGVFLTDSRYTIQAAEQVSDLPTRSFRSPQKAEEFLGQVVGELGLPNLTFDRGHVTVGRLEKWKSCLQSVELTPIDDPVDELRMFKSEDEVERMRRACVLADQAIELLVSLIKPDISELELFYAFEDFLRRNGATSAFDPIMISGPRTARPHGDPSERKLEPGDLVTFDLGARVDGYCSDITRTVVLGEASDRQREIYNHLLKTQIACIEAMKPGASGKAVDAMARELLAEKDLAQYFGHGLGHGLGALVHDSGRLSQTVDCEIKTGHVWTIEPGVYIEGFGGMRIEDDILITKDGAEILTHFPKELLEIPC